jgi:hypothetical protein
VNAAIRLSQLSVFNRPRRIGVLAVLKGFFDDSRTDPKKGTASWVVGGYLGDYLHWEGYNGLWPMALANHEVPYYHGKEFLDPRGPYQKWQPLYAHGKEIADFMGDLIKVIGQSGLRGFASVVRQPDLDRFNREKGLQLEPYPLAVYGCMIAITNEYAFEHMELFFDAVEQVDSKLCTARRYADSDSYRKDDKFGRMLLNPLTKCFGFEKIIELQAADFIAGDFRKQHLSVDEWFKLEGKPQTFEERGDHFGEWTLQKYGTKTPSLRKSLQAVVERTPHVLFVWDYDNLCEAHRVRGGVWA